MTLSPLVITQKYNSAVIVYCMECGFFYSEDCRVTAKSRLVDEQIEE